MFHMAVFMMIPGYCWKKQISTWKEWKRYVYSKVLRLYIPFVICNGIFVLLGNFFLNIGVYTDNPELLELSQNWPVSQTVYGYKNIREILSQLIKTILFIGPTRLGTATWFLTNMFIVLVVHSGIELAIEKTDIHHKEYIYILLGILTGIMAQIITVVEPTLIYPIKCFPSMYFAFLLGLGIRRREKSYSSLSAVISFIVLVIISRYYSIEVSAGRIGNIIVYSVSSVCGWILLKTVSDLIRDRTSIANELQFIGQHTIPILCLHVLCFKTVSLIYIKSKGLTNVLLASYHVIFDADEIWKIIYSIVGVVIPLALFGAYSNVKCILEKFGM